MNTQRVQSRVLMILLALTVALFIISGANTANGQENEHPWPFLGRTATRIGNAPWDGPLTDRIIWSLEFTTFVGEPQNESSCVMDNKSRIFIGGTNNVSAVDTRKRKLLWEFVSNDTISPTPAVWGDYVLAGETSGGPYFFCLWADDGEVVWKIQRQPGFDVSPVVDSNGVVYFDDRDGMSFARRVVDGSEVWTVQLKDRSTLSSPSLLEPTHLIGDEDVSDAVALDPANGSRKWTFPTGRNLRGVPPIADGNVYVGSWDRYVYSIDATTGEENWRFWCEQFVNGAVCVGHDGTIYVATHSNEIGLVFAISPDGEEIWRWNADGMVFAPPIVDGWGTIYLTSHIPVSRRGFVHAINSDGTELWTREMPDMCSSSPMLAPDGTLYIVCRDKRVYAFRDDPRPHLELQAIPPARPGQSSGIKLRITDLTPGGRAAIVVAQDTGRFIVPHTNRACAGIEIDLDPLTMQIAHVFRAGDNGDATITLDLPAILRGDDDHTGLVIENLYVQVVDIEDCDTSNVEAIVE